MSAIPLTAEMAKKFDKSYKKCMFFIDKIFYNEIKLRETGEQEYSDASHAAKEMLLHELDPLNQNGIMSLQVETGYPPIPPLNSPFRFGSKTRKRRANQSAEKPAPKRQSMLNRFISIREPVVEQRLRVPKMNNNNNNNISLAQKD
jgi:hypothetical protein